MIKIRLSRLGKRNSPFYRIVAMDIRSKRSGQALEILGFWNPVKKLFKIDNKKYDKWISLGAKPTEAITKLLKK